MDKISGILGLTGINAAGNNFALEALASAPANDSISFSGSEAINAFGRINVASLEDEESVGSENNGEAGAEGAEGAENAEAAKKAGKAADEEIVIQKNSEKADTEAAEDAKKADETNKAKTAAQAKAKAAAEKLDVSNKKVADADAKVSAAEAELDKIEAEGEIEGKEANTKDTLDALKAEMEDIKREQETKLREREELENKQNQLVEDLAEAQADGNKEKIQELGGELNGVNQKLDGVQNDLESLNSRRDNLQNNIDSTQRQLEQEQQAKAQAQQDKTNAANQAKQDAAGEAAQAHQEQQGAAQEANQANQTAQQADQQATQAQAQADASKTQAEQAKTAAETAKAQAQSARADAEAKEAEAAEADAAVAEAESALAAAQSATKTVTNEDGTTSEVPDEAAIAAAQAQLDAATAAADAAHAAADEAAATADQLEAESGVAEQEAAQAKTEATADAAEAKEASAEAKEADTASQEAAAGAEAADSAAQAADQTNDRAQNVSDKAEADNSAVQSAAENTASQAADNGASGSGASGSGGAGESAAGAGGAGETASASSERAADAVKEAEASVSNAVNKANDLDFSECADGDVASGINSYCEAKGYDVPEGFGETLVEYAKENDVDPAVALAICEENNFGADGNGMMGLSSAENQKQEAAGEGGIFSKIADKISEAFNGTPKTDDAWKEELSAGMAEFAAKREAAGLSSKDSVEAQLEAVGKSGWGGVSDASKWAEAVGDKYTQDVSPYMLDNVKGCDTQLGSNISSALEAVLAMEGMTETGDTDAINALINEYDPSWPLDCSTTPWCAAFASSILNEYGVMDFSGCENTNYCPSLQAWAENEGNWHANDGSYTPTEGSMVLFNWDGGDVDHVGIVTGYDPDTDTLYTIEGNTSDAVHQRSYSPASSLGTVSGYIEPNGANADKAGEAAQSSSAAAGQAAGAENAQSTAETGKVGEVAARIAEALESAEGASDKSGVASAIQEALAMEGMTETADTEAINALISEYDPSWALDCSTTPWCAAFASSILNENGVMDFSGCENTNYCPSLKSWAENEGNWRGNDGSYTPTEGSMVLFNWDGGDVDHVGIVTGYDPETDTLYTVEGNTSDAVHQRSYSPASSLDTISGYIEPNGPNAEKNVGESSVMGFIQASANGEQTGKVGEVTARIAEALESAKGASDNSGVASAIQEALAMEGMTETADTEAINALISEYDPSWALDCSTTPWCAAFASSILNENGVMDFSGCENTNYCPSLKSWAENEGNWRGNDGSYTPTEGSMVLFNWDGGDVDHVGIVTGYDPETDTLYTVEGNTSDAVHQRSYSPASSLDTISGYIEPNGPNAEKNVGESSVMGFIQASANGEQTGKVGEVAARIAEALESAKGASQNNIPSAIEAALAMEGMTETGDTEAINALINEYDPSWTLDCSTTPWCAAFASSVLNEYGVMDFSNCENANYCPSLQSWAEGEGTWRANDGSYTPGEGSMVLFNWDGGEVDHVGIVTGYDPDTDTLYTVEGNTSDAVHQRSYSPASSLGTIAGYIEPNGPNAGRTEPGQMTVFNFDEAGHGHIGEAIANAIAANGVNGGSSINSAIEAAMAMEGMTETGDTEAINALINEYDPSWALDCSTTPWCAAFASSVLNEYGVMDFSNCENANYCPSLQSWAEGEGTWRVNDGSYIPGEGSMVLFNWDGGEVDHVGIVTGYDPQTDTLYTIEGNTSDAVHQRTYSPASSMGEISGYIEPNGPNAKKSANSSVMGFIQGAGAEANRPWNAEYAAGILNEAEFASHAGETVANAVKVIDGINNFFNNGPKNNIESAIKAAVGMEGMTETTDTAAINALINEYDPSWTLDCSTTPWCAAFASSVLNEYGVMDFSNCENANYCPSLQSWAEGEGTWRVNDGAYTPTEGSMVLFNWDGGEVDHVGIVTGYDPDTDTLYTVEGNTSDAVHQRSYSPASSLGTISGYIEPNGPNAGRTEETNSMMSLGEVAASMSEAIESLQGGVQSASQTNIASALEAALAMEGMTETGDTEAINALINEYDPSWPLDCSTTPWCAAFASSILNEYGVMDFSNCENTNYCPSLQSWAEGEGTWRVNDGSYTPSEGSMVLFNWDGGEVDHVGIVTGYDPETDTLYTIEGNSSDAVNQRSYSPASSLGTVAGYIEPNGPNAVKEGETAKEPAVQNAASGEAGSEAAASGLSTKRLFDLDQGQYDALIVNAADKYGVDPNLVKAMISQESGFDPNATSGAGAQGLMQLMPSTAAGLGCTDSYDPEQNIEAGTKYISQMLNKFNGDVSLALAAYNAGEGNVAKYGGIPPFTETQNYVTLVLGYYNDYIS